MSEKNERVRKKEFLSLPFLTLIVMLLITIGATFLFYQNAINKDRVRFKNEVKVLTKAFDNKISTSIALLKAVRGYIETDDNVNSNEFRKFIKSFEISEKFKSLQGIGYAERVVSDDLEKVTQKLNNDGINNFKIFPEGERDEFIVVIFIEPKDFQNEQEIGFDMATEDVLQDAMQSANNTGQPTASGITNLLPNNNKEGEIGFYIYLPVYQNSDFPKSSDDRNRLLKGYVFCSFRANDFVTEVSQTISKNEVGILLYDEATNPENLFAVSQLELIETNSKWVDAENLNVAERKWIAQYKSLPSFSENSEVIWTFLVPIIGLLLSFLLFSITYSEANSRQKFEVAVDELSRTQKEKNQLLRSEKKAREQAERSNRIKDEFLSVVSHELRTPLNSIAGWTKILEGHNLTEQTKQRAIKTIEKNIRSQSKLVEELLEFSKINSTNIKLNKELVEFKSLVENLVNEIKPLAEEKKIKFINNNNLNSEKINCEEQTIKNAFMNLFRNAIKFTPPNGKIEIFTQRENDLVLLRIKDYGQGIEKEFLPHIFEEFSQADSSTTRKYGGLGLGLAISRQIIRLHNGDILVKSEGKDKGTEFIVKLPVELKKDQT